MDFLTFQSLFIILASVLAVRADSNYFITPPTNGVIHDYSQNPSYQIGQTVDLKWSTTYDKISLYLWQNNNSTAVPILDEENAVQSQAWTIDLTGSFSLADGNIFFFQLYQGSTQNFFSSHYFNITANSGASSSTSSVSATSTVTGATSATAANAAATSNAQSSPTSSSNSTSGLSSGAEIGIGVGVGVGAAAIIAAIAVFFFLRRRKSKAATNNAKTWQEGSVESSQMGQATHPPHDGNKSAYYSQPPNVYAHYADGGSGSGYNSPVPAYQPPAQHQHAPAAELSGEHARSELGGQVYRSELGGESAASELGTKP